MLTELRALGLRLAVDDYGTGYSSLAYLQELAVDELKLDKSFVMRMTEDPGAAAIVRTTIDLAQGYHISKPLPAEQLTGWLQARSQPQPTPPHATPVMSPPS